MREDSAVAQVAALEPGESYSKARFIPSNVVTPEKIRLAKRRLVSTLTSVLGRQKNETDYQIHSFHNLTRNCDVVVAAVIVREPEL